MNQGKVKRPFGLWSAIFLVVANMIGAGVFTTSGFSLAGLGSREHVMLAWLIGGMIALCGAISYGQLARRITESGGEYLFLARRIHPAVGFLAGWVSLLAGFTGAIAFAATTFETYAIPDSVRPQWFIPGSAAIGAIVVFGGLHAAILRLGVTTQNVIVGLKLVLLAVFVVSAFWIYPEGWEGMKESAPSAPLSIYGLASTLVWISLSFSGFNAAVYITSEVESPERNVPRALFWGTLLVTVFYLTLNYVFVYGPSAESITGVPEVAAVAAESLGGRTLANLVRVIVSIALLSSVSSMIIAGPRVYAKMAADGVFPKCFALKGTHDRDDVPAMAIAMQVVLASLVVYFYSLKDLLDYLGFTLSISAALTVMCLFWGRSVVGADERSFSKVSPVYLVIAGVYVVATLGLAALALVERPQQSVGLLATVVSGLVLYRLFKKS